MFENRYQIGQVFLAGSLLLTGLALGWLIFGTPLVGFFFLLLAHGCAAGGCCYFALDRGYPGWLGLAVGGLMGAFGAAVMVFVLPDEAAIDPFEEQRELADEGLRNARRRDPGYEVIEEEDD